MMNYNVHVRHDLLFLLSFIIYKMYSYIIYLNDTLNAGITEYEFVIISIRWTIVSSFNKLQLPFQKNRLYFNHLFNVLLI